MGSSKWDLIDPWLAGKVREVDCSQMLKGSCLPLPLIEIFLKNSDSTRFMVFKGFQRVPGLDR